ncbi:hypothetical protein FA048_14635 [Pedobacter polaris]|uniref:DUF1440 domain-containing protein n=1 Tax=Pedobacter polaris TaxID=2571273 RepID=A0A4U1CP21_9SPHI|nr:hypothetical protein [Pedobacter polaris]TKC08388.1 hypothetical protein FA048_14635 [Pedobacter polaris]
MGFIKNITAGFVGSVALTVLHEIVRKNATNVPKINVLGEEALNKTLSKFGTPITDEDELYRTTLKADLTANAMYYSLIGGNTKWIWPKAVLLGLCAGIGALKLPEPLGLDPEPVTRTNQTKALTVGYYLFGALVTGLVLKKLSK